MITKPYRNKKYLAWVAAQDSVLSFQPAGDHHHMKGHGQGGSTKAPDCFVFPLTREEHTEFHNIGWETWERKHGSQWSFVAKTLYKAIIEGFEF